MAILNYDTLSVIHSEVFSFWPQILKWLSRNTIFDYWLLAEALDTIVVTDICAVISEVTDDSQYLILQYSVVSSTWPLYNGSIENEKLYLQRNCLSSAAFGSLLMA